MEQTEMITAKDGVWKMDVDAFVPAPEGSITVNGVEYSIYNFLDVPIGDSFRVARLAEDIKAAESYEDRMARSIDQVILLNKPAIKVGKPVLTPECFEGMTPREIITVTVLASSVAQVPLKADRENSDKSLLRSPESADSTGGDGKTSSV